VAPCVSPLLHPQPDLLTAIVFSQDRKKQPPYGADVLRLWVATVEYGTDMNIGPTIIASCMEMVRRVRNSARFILGNLGSGGEEHWERVTKNDLGLVSGSEALGLIPCP
jgi:isoleucyl-tRNA synthetase